MSSFNRIRGLGPVWSRERKDGISQRVLVTGATGFVAQHCILQLLEAGYDVRGTVRSLERGDSVRDILSPHLSPAVRSHLAQDLEFVEATLTSDDGWAGAVEGCRFVLHVASPFPPGIPKHEDDLIVPARDGTLRVLRAASEAGVERVVLTSSVTSIYYGLERNHTFNESDWTNIESRKIGAYEKSKTIAERAAWQFMESLDERSTMELVVINPGLVLGPLLTKEWSLSGETVKKIMDRALPAVPDYQVVAIDVRDVALAHVRAMTIREAAGTRIICAIESHNLREIAQILAEEYTQRGFKIPSRKLPNFMVPIAALFVKEARIIVSEVGLPLDVDTSKLTTVLGISPRGLREMTVAMADSMIEYGVVKPRK